MGLFGTGLRFSAAFHPQTQGLVTRMNAVIGQISSCTLASMNGGKNWVEILSIVELAINSMPNKITGYSPFYLNYGYHPTVPSDLIDCSEATQNEFLSDFVKRMDIVRTKSVTQMKNAQEVRARYYNKHHRMVEFDVGNLVC